MKKIIRLTLVFALVTGSMSAQQEKGITGSNNWLNPWTEFKPGQVTYDKPTQILSGDITRDTKLSKKEIYLLLGDVFVTDSTTITIEPGTVIIGDYKTKGSLTITNGSRIVALGSATDPIVFTSSRSLKKPGDWGGIFLLGDAPTNKFNGKGTLNYGLKPSSLQNLSYGGDNVESNSGILSYVRIEYAGKRTKDHGYFNGLTLAGVGQQTIIDNVMVSYCQGISFNFIGGDVILDKLVSYRSSIHDFEFNNGVQSRISNSLAVKSPYVSGPEASKSMNILAYDQQGEADFSKSPTTVEAENLTLVNVSNDLTHDMRIGLVNEAIFIAANTSFSIHKSVISGFKPAAILDRKIMLNNDSLKKILFTSTYFNNCEGNIFKKGFSNNDDLENWYGSRAFDNVYSKGPDSETFIDSHNSKRPDFRLRINKIIASKDY